MASSFLQDVVQLGGTLLNPMTPSPNYRTASGITNRDRQVMTWVLPNSSSIQMYVNPENFVINESKQITSTRTKGGFVVQYWGDNLTKLTMSGTTGSSGISGINVLRSIYHSENQIFAQIASNTSADLLNQQSSSSTFPSTQSNIGQQLVSYMQSQLQNRNFIMRPSLASLALGVVLYYQGIQYKGFFNSITITEDVNRLGLFQYNIEFTATDISGVRSNFMAWHKEALAIDPTNQFVNSMVSKIGNLALGALGLAPSQMVPAQFHPENSPLSFGA